TYVDITRGRNSNHLFLARAPDPLDGEHLPKLPPSPLTAVVTERLSRSGSELTAIERPVAPARTWTPEGDSPWASRLPDPAAGPGDAVRRWRAAVQAVSAYRSRWVISDGSGDWEWAVGPVVPDPLALAERDVALNLLHAYAHTTAAEHVAASEHATEAGIE